MLQIILIYLWILYVKKHIVIYEYPVKLGVFEWNSKGPQWWWDLLSQWNKKFREERAFSRYLIQQFKYVIRTWVYLSFHIAVLHMLSSAYLLSSTVWLPQSEAPHVDTTASSKREGSLLSSVALF